MPEEHSQSLARAAAAQRREDKRAAELDRKTKVEQAVDHWYEQRHTIREQLIAAIMAETGASRRVIEADWQSCVGDLDWERK